MVSGVSQRPRPTQRPCKWDPVKASTWRSIVPPLPALLPREEARKRAAEVEKEIDRWWQPRPSVAGRIAGLVTRGVDLTGVWETTLSFEDVQLWLLRSSPGCYYAIYFTENNGDGWYLRRRARFSRGVLLFDRPVMGICEVKEVVFRRMYLARFKGELVLVEHPEAFEVPKGRKHEACLGCLRRTGRRWEFAPSRRQPVRRQPGIAPR